MSIVQEKKIDINLLHRIAHAGAKLAKARRERNLAAAQLITSIPPELRAIKSTLSTLLRVKSPEFFELYERRERILNEWKSQNSEVIAKLAKAMREYFKASEEIATLSESITAD